MPCAKCGTRLPARKPGAGRPRSYCGTPCRRAAEMEIRRVQDALSKVEELQRQVRFGWGQHRPDEAAAFDAEHERLEARLRELLAGGGDE